MSDQERYLQFMEQESELANQERISFGNIEQVSSLVDMLQNKEQPSVVENFISKNLTILFNYAPHLTIQIYLAIIASQNRQYELPDKLAVLRDRQDLPAKAYSVINSYLSILKEKETASPDASFASDQKIVETVDNLSPQKITRLVFALQVRLETGTEFDHFVDLLNPFMSSPVKDPMYKLSLLTQLSLITSKHPATKPLNILIDNQMYSVILDNSLDPSLDPFLRTVEYYSSSLGLKGNLKDLLSSFASMYRVLHYNEPKILNSEADIKSFCCCLLDSYNQNVSSFSPSSVFKVDYPESYKEEKGWKEASKFLNVAFRPRYS
jgi:hypothetical protein